MRRLATFFLAAIVSSVICFLPAVAQQNNNTLSLTSSPLPISLKTKPSETVATDLRIRNSGGQPEKLNVGLMKFSALGDTGQPKLEERAPGDDYFDWVSFSERSFVAQPNEWHTINMKITVPADAAFGYYYAVTFSRAGSTQDAKTPVVEGATATLVLLEVENPNAKKELQLESFTTAKKTYEFLPARFSVKVKNTGNIHVKPSGTIFIKKAGKVIATVPVNSTGGTILPESSRVFLSEWGEGFPSYVEKIENDATVYKDGEIQYQLNWDFSKVKNMRFGKYTADLVLVYDDGTRDVPLEAALSFWVIPWRLLALFIGLPLIIIGVIVYLVLSRRKYKKKSVYRH